MHVELVGKAVGKRDDILVALKDLLTSVDAVWLISDPVVLSDKRALTKVFETCDSEKVPIFSYHKSYAAYGATMTVSPDNPTVGRQAARISQEVLSGVAIETKVQLPAGSHIILNMNRVKKYGLDYNKNALSGVNEVIE